jgi:hypothetical protein
MKKKSVIDKVQSGKEQKKAIIHDEKFRMISYSNSKLEGQVS